MRRLLPLVSVSLIGCGGAWSALAPAGRDAERIARLFWWMAGGATVVWLLVVLLTAAALRTQSSDRKKIRLLVVGGGTVLPSVVLAVLLGFGLSEMPQLLAPGPRDGPHIQIRGTQWWWRVRYQMPNGDRFELANELRLPRGYRMPLLLESEDVIHSFWVPSLAGKMDMIPGRVTRLALEPTRAGTFGGVCAEFCGTSHARMMFHVVVVEPAEFEAWVIRQMEPARLSSEAKLERGAALFAAHGCGACHALRGTSADGRIGPDLTHVGGRVSIGAGILDNDIDGFTRWLSELKHLKPEVQMPSFHMMSAAEARDVSAFLDSLE